jgi:DNA polymerase-3 subunit delta
MKLTFRQIEPFVKNPDPNARVILVYGPDQGLMAERTRAISLSYVPDLSDPFNVINLTSAQITDDPAAFYDEANAQSLMGGNRLITIKDGADAITPVMKDYLENASNETLIIIESDNLGPRSSLRKLCESAKNAAAVPCYVDDERSMTQIIRDMCAHAGYKIDNEALNALSSAIIGDRSIARNEIEKLILYKGWPEKYDGLNNAQAAANQGQITLSDIVASCGDVRDWDTDTLIYAMADGRALHAKQVLAGMFKDQIAPIVILRSIQNHFWRLLSVKNKMTDGMDQTTALKTLNPPLFWKVEDAFKRQLNNWSIPTLESAMDALNKVEIMSKQTGYIDTALVENCIMQIARHAPSGNRRAA